MYETQSISVFSDAKMNIAHYLAGFIHYAGVILAILGESEGFIKGTQTFVYFTLLYFTLLYQFTLFYLNSLLSFI